MLRYKFESIPEISELILKYNITFDNGFYECYDDVFRGYINGAWMMYRLCNKE